MPNFNIVSSRLNDIYLYIKNTSRQITKSYSFFFILTSIWSASSLFFHLLKTGEILYQIKRKKISFFTRILSIFLVFLFLITLTSSVGLFVIITYLSRFINYRVIYLLGEAFIVVIIPFLITLFFNIFVPPVKLTFRQIFKGSVFTLVYWIIITIGFTIYLKIFVNFKIVYGALSFVIVFMIWIYLLAIGLVLGLIINYLNWLKLTEYNNSLT